MDQATTKVVFYENIVREQLAHHSWRVAEHTYKNIQNITANKKYSWPEKIQEAGTKLDCRKREKSLTAYEVCKAIKYLRNIEWHITETGPSVHHIHGDLFLHMYTNPIFSHYDYPTLSLFKCLF